jgi:hypothetical protein
MTTRLINNAEDYATFEPWWVKHQGQSIPLAALPPVGVVALDDDGTPAAAGWLYMAVGVGVAWMAWITTNPDLPAFRALRGLSLVEGGLEALAKTHNYNVVFTETQKPALVRWMQARGYVKNHSNITQLLKRV